MTGGSLIEDCVVEANRCGLNAGRVHSYGDGVMSKGGEMALGAGAYL